MPKARGQPSQAEAKMLEMRRIFGGESENGDPTAWVFVEEASAAGRSFTEAYSAARRRAGLAPLPGPGLQRVGAYFARDPRDASEAEKIFFHYCNNLAAFFAHPANLGKLGLLARQYLAAYGDEPLLQGLDPRVPPVLRELEQKLSAWAPGRRSAVADILRLLYNRALALLGAGEEASILEVRSLGPGGKTLTVIDRPASLAAAMRVEEKQMAEQGRFFVYDQVAPCVRETTGPNEPRALVVYAVGSCYNTINILRRAVLAEGNGGQPFSLLALAHGLERFGGAARAENRTKTPPPAAAGEGQNPFAAGAKATSAGAGPFFRDLKSTPGPKAPGGNSTGPAAAGSSWGNLWNDMKKPGGAVGLEQGTASSGAAPVGGRSGNFSQAFRSTEQSSQRDRVPHGTCGTGAAAPERMPPPRTTYEYSPHNDEHPLTNFVLGAIFFFCASAVVYVLVRFSRLIWICDNYREQPFPFSLFAAFYHFLFWAIFACLGGLWWVLKSFWNVNPTGYPKVDLIIGVALILGFLRLFGFVFVQPVARFIARDDLGSIFLLGAGALVFLPGLLGWILTTVGWLFSS